MSQIRILIVDDHPIFRQGIRQLLDQSADMWVVGEASDGESAINEVQKWHPEVVLLDISLPDQNGLDLTRRLLGLDPQLRIVILSMHEREGYIIQALDAGAYAYVLKGSPGESILAAIRSAQRNEHYLCPLIKPDIIKGLLRDRRSGNLGRSYDVLTDREQQVFRLLAEGHSTTAIARRLCVSPKTVEKHRVNILHKLNLDSLVELVKYAIAIGVVELDFPMR